MMIHCRARKTSARACSICGANATNNKDRTNDNHNVFGRKNIMNETECRFCEKQAGDTGTCEMINWCRQDVRACDHYVPQKKIYFKLPPELVDGEHWTVVEKISTVQDAGPMTLEESIAHVEGGFRSNMADGHECFDPFEGWDDYDPVEAEREELSESGEGTNNGG